MLIAGRAYEVVSQLDVTTVRRLSDAEANTVGMTPNYGGRRRRLFRHFAEHIRAGCGFCDPVTPVISQSGGWLWFHFGGELLEAFLIEILGRTRVQPAIRGIALASSDRFTAQHIAVPDDVVRDWQSRHQLAILSESNLGKWARSLPEVLHESMLREAGVFGRWTEWLATRKFEDVASITQAETLRRLL